MNDTGTLQILYEHVNVHIKVYGWEIFILKLEKLYVIYFQNFVKTNV